MVIDEKSYEAGSRMAWRIILATACRELGYDDIEAAKASWIAEREAAVAALRRVCDQFGDNNWADNLHLADIIEKHLHTH